MTDAEVRILQEAHDTIQKMRAGRAEREASKSNAAEAESDSESRVH